VSVFQILVCVIQGDSEGKTNILGGDSICHSEEILVWRCV